MTGDPRWLRGRTAPLLLAALVALVYLPSLGNGFVYDDHEVILAQPRPGSAPDLARVFAEPHFHGLPYYRPVVRATLLGQKALHGDSAPLFHLGNLLLAVAMALAARALLLRPAFGIARAPAFVAAWLFAVHPVASSVVLPVASGRETLLPALLSVLAVWAWLGGTPRWRAVAVAAFAGALFGKEASVVLPVLLVAADGLGLAPDAPRGRDPGAWLRRHAPVLAVLALYLAIRSALFAGGEWRLALLADPLGPLRSLGFALQSAVAPTWALAYEPELAVWVSAPRLGLALAVTALLAWAAWRGGAASRRAGLFWLAWLGLSLLPTANLLHQEAPYDERYAFLALLAPLAIAAAWLSRLSAQAPASGRVALAAGIVLAVAASVVSVTRARTFRDDEAFARQWLATNPRSAEAHHALGLVLVQEGRTLEGRAHYVQALSLAPDFVDARNNLAAALAAEGRMAEARAELEQVLAVDPAHPEAWNNLGLVSAAEGSLDAAETAYRRALELAPRFAEAHNNLATTLARQGRLAEAERALRAALRIAPGYADARRNLAIVRGRREGSP